MANASSQPQRRYFDVLFRPPAQTGNHWKEDEQRPVNTLSIM
jgi:hypothetical protein